MSLAPATEWFCECSHTERDHSTMPVIFESEGRDYERYPCHVLTCMCTDYEQADEEEWPDVEADTTEHT